MQRKADLVAVSDLGEAIALLTRLPLRADVRRGGAAAWAWPVAGLLVALIAAGVGQAAAGLGLASPIVAGLVLASLVLLTGALHEDGLADSADGLWGGWEVERRLEIMRDSRIGAYGVIALILGLGLRWAALAALVAEGAVLPGLVASATLSRAAMAALMAALPPARLGGLSAATGRPRAATAALAAALAGGAALAALGTAGLLAVAVAAALAILWGGIARKRIGGQTGDILGAGQQITEIGILILAATFA